MSVAAPVARSSETSVDPKNCTHTSSLAPPTYATYHTPEVGQPRNPRLTAFPSKPPTPHSEERRWLERAETAQVRGGRSVVVVVVVAAAVVVVGSGVDGGQRC